MNILVAGNSQVLYAENWPPRLNFMSNETGNALDQAGIALLSTTIDIGALRAYRLSVGRATQQIVKGLRHGKFKQKVDPADLERVLNEGAVVESTHWLIDYWGKKSIVGLLLMPPTRHNFIHLNEALRLKQKLLHETA
jgi:hypothetical protein